MFRLDSIRHDPANKPPLVVTFTADDTQCQVRCSGRDLGSFSSFQHLAADRLGCWLDGSDYYSGRVYCSDRWQWEVRTAFEAGRAAR